MRYRFDGLGVVGCGGDGDDVAPGARGALDRATRAAAAVGDEADVGGVERHAVGGDGHRAGEAAERERPVVAGGVQRVGALALERSAEPARERRLLAGDGGLDRGGVDAASPRWPRSRRR